MVRKKEKRHSMLPSLFVKNFTENNVLVNNVILVAFITTSQRVSRQTYYTIIALRYGMVTYATALCSGQYHVYRHDTLFTL